MAGLVDSWLKRVEDFVGLKNGFEPHRRAIEAVLRDLGISGDVKIVCRSSHACCCAEIPIEDRGIIERLGRVISYLMGSERSVSSANLLVTTCLIDEVSDARYIDNDHVETLINAGLIKEFYAEERYLHGYLHSAAYVAVIDKRFVDVDNRSILVLIVVEALK